jgi:hypothetical protein
MLEKGSHTHKAVVRLARTVLGCSEVEELQTENAVLGVAQVDAKYNSEEALEAARRRQEELVVEIALAKIRQGCWGKLQDRVREEHYLWCD